MSYRPAFQNSDQDINGNDNSLDSAIFNLTDNSTPKTPDSSKESTPSKSRFKSKRKWFKKALSLDITVTREIRAESLDSYLSGSELSKQPLLSVDPNIYKDSNELANDHKNNGKNHVSNERKFPVAAESDKVEANRLTTDTAVPLSRVRSKSDRTAYNGNHQDSPSPSESHDDHEDINKETNDDDELKIKPG